MKKYYYKYIPQKMNRDGVTGAILVRKLYRDGDFNNAKFSPDFYECYGILYSEMLNNATFHLKMINFNSHSEEGAVPWNYPEPDDER